MLAKIRKYISPALKERVLTFLPYRLLSRYQVTHHKVRFICEVTTRCNIACDMCSRPSLAREGGLNVGDMDEKLIGRVVEEIKRLHDYGKGVYFETLGLGEPLLYKGLFGLFGRLKNISPKIGIVLVTNGILLDEAASRSLIALGVNEVNVSLNAADKASYQRHMGQDAYEKVSANIENLIKLRNKSGARAPSVYIQYLDYDNNQSVFQEGIKRWLEIMRYNDKCYVHPILNQGGFVTRRTSFEFPNQRHPCPEPLYGVVVKINGDMYPCCASPYSGAKKIPSLYLGNIMTDSPLDQFLDRHSRRYGIIEDMRRDDYSQLAECARCNTYIIGCNCYFKIPRPFRFGGHKWM